MFDPRNALRHAKVKAHGVRWIAPLSNKRVQMRRKANPPLSDEVEASLERLEIAQSDFSSAVDALLPR